MNDAAVGVAASNSPPLLSPLAELALGCILALLASMLFAYLWTHSAYNRRPVTNVLVGIASTIGVTVLSGWNVPHIGPAHGICWVIGFFATTLIVRRAIIANHSAGVGHLPRRIQIDFRAYVSRVVFSQDAAQADKSIKLRRAALIREHEAHERAGAAAMHEYIHCVRDAAVFYLGNLESLKKELLITKNLALFEQHLNSAFHAHLDKIAEKIVRLFERVTGQRDLWVAIRMLDEQDGERSYKTILRAGSVNPDRSQHSVAVPEKSGLPAHLRAEYARNRGIVILGKKRRPEQWLRTPNDVREEDNGIMAGPVIVKSLEGQAEKKEMLMILYVNSPTEGCFAETHRDIMRCCTDTLSMFFSLASQLDVGTEIARASPLTIKGK